MTAQQGGALRFSRDEWNAIFEASKDRVPTYRATYVAMRVTFFGGLAMTAAIAIASSVMLAAGAFFATATAFLSIRFVHSKRIMAALYWVLCMRYPDFDMPKQEDAVRIDLPPGWRFLNIARIVFSPKVADRVFAQTVRDMSDEYVEAVRDGNLCLARWIRVRGHIALVHALVLQLGVSTLKQIVELWKLGK